MPHPTHIVDFGQPLDNQQVVELLELDKADYDRFFDEQGQMVARRSGSGESKVELFITDEHHYILDLAKSIGSVQTLQR